MRANGIHVVTFFDEFPRGTPDPHWLPIVTARRWVLITKDDKWRYRHRSKARAFVFASKTARRSEIARAIVAAIPKMRDIIDSPDPPFIARVFASAQVTPVYPRDASE